VRDLRGCEPGRTADHAANGVEHLSRGRDGIAGTHWDAGDPELHGRHEATEPARQKWKAELAEKAVARRTEAPRKADPDYRVNPIATGISETIADLAPAENGA